MVFTLIYIHQNDIYIYKHIYLPNTYKPCGFESQESRIIYKIYIYNVPSHVCSLTSPSETVKSSLLVTSSFNIPVYVILWGCNWVSRFALFRFLLKWRWRCHRRCLWLPPKKPCHLVLQRLSSQSNFLTPFLFLASRFHLINLRIYICIFNWVILTWYAILCCDVCWSELYIYIQ